MKLQKFAKKIAKAADEHFDNMGEYMSDVESAQSVVDLVDARDEAGKDSSDIYLLEQAARALVAASEEFADAMADFDDATAE